MTPNSDCKLYIRLTNHFSKYIKYKNFIGLDYQLIIVNYDKQPTLTNKCNLTKKCYCMGKEKNVPLLLVVKGSIFPLICWYFLCNLKFLYSFRILFLIANNHSFTDRHLLLWWFKQKRVNFNVWSRYYFRFSSG